MSNKIITSGFRIKIKILSSFGGCVFFCFVCQQPLNIPNLPTIYYTILCEVFDISGNCRETYYNIIHWYVLDGKKSRRSSWWCEGGGESTKIVKCNKNEFITVRLTEARSRRDRVHTPVYRVIKNVGMIISLILGLINNHMITLLHI